MYLRHEHAPRRHVTRHLGWGTYYGTQPRTCPTKAPNRALALLRHPTAHLLYSTTARDDALEVAAAAGGEAACADAACRGGEAECRQPCARRRC